MGSRSSRVTLALELEGYSSIPLFLVVRFSTQTIPLFPGLFKAFIPLPESEVHDCTN